MTTMHFTVLEENGMIGSFIISSRWLLYT